MTLIEQSARSLVAALKTMQIHPSHYAELEEALANQDAARSLYADAVQQARETHATDDLEIDDVASVSEAEGGCWVSAWLWVPESTDH